MEERRRPRPGGKTQSWTGSTNSQSDGKKIMTNTASLPWDVDTTVATTSGTDLHARATSLAHAAMEAAALQPITDPADTDYGRAQAEYHRRLAEIRAESAQRHVAANNARAEAARQAKAERIAAHEQRLAEAKQAKIERKLAKAA